jgi:hypothetical protein
VAWLYLAWGKENYWVPANTVMKILMPKNWSNLLLYEDFLAFQEGLSFMELFDYVGKDRLQIVMYITA